MTLWRKLLQIAVLLLPIVLVAPALGQERVVYGYKVINTYPHDIGFFTQGFVFDDGHLYEGSGKLGLSTLTKRTLEDPAPLMNKRMSDRHFGEGVQVVGDKILQLTWQSHIVFVYDI